MKNTLLAFILSIILSTPVLSGVTEDFEESLEFKQKTYYRSKRYYDKKDDVVYVIVERIHYGSFDPSGRWNPKKPMAGGAYKYEYYMGQGCRKVGNFYKATQMWYYQKWNGNGELEVVKNQCGRRNGICLCMDGKGGGLALTGCPGDKFRERIIVREPDPMARFVKLVETKTKNVRWRNNVIVSNQFYKSETCK